MRPRRSCLAVPASNVRMMEKAASLSVDHLVFDLEDACAPTMKEDARGLAVAALRSHDFGSKLRTIRINGVATPWCHGDLVEVVTGAHDVLDAIVVPKVEDASHVHFVHHLLGGIERAAGSTARIDLELLIESAAGVANLSEIVRASDRIVALIFGPADYAASVGSPHAEIGMSDDRYPGHQWHWPMSQIVAHARTIGALAIDGPHADYTDPTPYRRSALWARLLGFDGKWCIHPNQVPWANDVFSSSPEEVAAARRILEAYERSTGTGRGAIAVDGKLVDEASRRLAEATLVRARVPEA